MQEQTVPNYEDLDPDVRLMLQVRDDNAAAFEELVTRYRVVCYRCFVTWSGGETIRKTWLKRYFCVFIVPGNDTFRVQNFPPGCSGLLTMLPAMRCGQHRGDAR